jgi:hypothetical protein
MSKRSFLISLFSICIIAFWATLPIGCANIIPPSGGPRDSIAPKLVSAVPKDSTLNFRGNRITFNFDEYIDDPQDLQNNLLFTPTFEVNPEIAVRAKTMTIRFLDSLLPNTTYSLNFGNAIRDINENNVLRNFVYTFSTGPALDSLTYSGKVVLAESGGTDSTLIVILHRNLTDSAVIKERPVYISRVDAAGNFRFQNLPQDTFAVYALGEAGIVRRYQNPSQLFAFANKPVVTGTTIEDTLYAYREKAAGATTPPAATPRGAVAGNERRLRFTTNPAAGNLDLQSDFIVNFQTPLRSFDSTQLAVTTDSIFAATSYSVSLDSSQTSLRIRSAWKEGTVYNLILNKDFAEDSAGRKLLKTDTLNFTTKRRSDYGQVRIRIRNLEGANNPVLQFVQNGQVVFSGPIKTGTFINNLFNPGDYDLRILYDRNNNGTWDAGQFFGVKRQPELVKPIERRISIKAAMDNEFDLSL